MIRASAVLLLMYISLGISASTVHRGASHRSNPIRRFRLLPREVKHDEYQNLNTADLESKREYRTFPKYEFKYTVSDPISGDYKTHRESKSGNQVKGEYSFVESDGYIRRVKYTADDEHGFVAVVSRDPIVTNQPPKLQSNSFGSSITSYILPSKNEIRPELNIEIVKAREYVPKEIIEKKSHDESIPYVLNIRHSKSTDQINQTDKNLIAREHETSGIKTFDHDVRNISSNTKYEVTEEKAPEDMKLSITQHSILTMDTGKNHLSLGNENSLETSPVTFPTPGSNEDFIIITKALENQIKPIKNNSESEEISKTSMA